MDLHNRASNRMDLLPSYHRMNIEMPCAKWVAHAKGSSEVATGYSCWLPKVVKVKKVSKQPSWHRPLRHVQARHSILSASISAYANTSSAKKPQKAQQELSTECQVAEKTDQNHATGLPQPSFVCSSLCGQDGVRSTSAARLFLLQHHQNTLGRLHAHIHASFAL